MTTPAQTKNERCHENTYKLKTVDQTNESTINICNLTALGKLLKSFLVSSNMILADSIIKFLNFSNILKIISLKS